MVKRDIHTAQRTDLAVSPRLGYQANIDSIKMENLCLLIGPVPNTPLAKALAK